MTDEIVDAPRQTGRERAHAGWMLAHLPIDHLQDTRSGIDLVRFARSFHAFLR
jgi:hypothetical protein